MPAGPGRGRENGLGTTWAPTPSPGGAGKLRPPGLAQLPHSDPGPPRLCLPRGGRRPRSRTPAAPCGTALPGGPAPDPGPRRASAPRDTSPRSGPGLHARSARRRRLLFLPPGAPLPLRPHAPAVSAPALRREPTSWGPAPATALPWRSQGPAAPGTLAPLPQGLHVLRKVPTLRCAGAARPTRFHVLEAARALSCAFPGKSKCSAALGQLLPVRARACTHFPASVCWDNTCRAKCLSFQVCERHRPESAWPSRPAHPAGAGYSDRVLGSGFQHLLPRPPARSDGSPRNWLYHLFPPSENQERPEETLQSAGPVASPYRWGAGSGVVSAALPGT
nr:transcription initiation factor TFIID subunit 4-like [Manis javanica]